MCGTFVLLNGTLLYFYLNPFYCDTVPYCVRDIPKYLSTNVAIEDLY